MSITTHDTVCTNTILRLSPVIDIAICCLTTFTSYETFCATYYIAMKAKIAYKSCFIYDKVYSYFKFSCLCSAKPLFHSSYQMPRSKKKTSQPPTPTYRLTVQNTAMENLKTMFDNGELQPTDSVRHAYLKDAKFRKYPFGQFSNRYALYKKSYFKGSSSRTLMFYIIAHFVINNHILK